MNKFKTILGIILCATLIFVTGCTQEKKLDGSLTEIMEKLYEGIDEEKLPMMLGNTEVTTENLQYYTGLTELDFKEALASESKVGSIAHSIILIRLNDESKVETVKQEIKEKINPNKWICVGVENVIVDNIGDVVVVIMSDEIGETMHTNFTNLVK